MATDYYPDFYVTEPDGSCYPTSVYPEWSHAEPVSSLGTGWWSSLGDYVFYIETDSSGNYPLALMIRWKNPRMGYPEDILPDHPGVFRQTGACWAYVWRQDMSPVQMDLDTLKEIDEIVMEMLL